jgi:SSS family solute:Na+ symporter
MISILRLDAALGLDYTTTLWIIVIVVAVIGAIYAISGGLRSVAVSDTLNGIGLPFGRTAHRLAGTARDRWRRWRVGGLDLLRETHPEKLNSIGGPESAVLSPPSSPASC